MLTLRSTAHCAFSIPYLQVTRIDIYTWSTIEILGFLVAYRVHVTTGDHREREALSASCYCLSILSRRARLDMRMNGGKSFAWSQCQLRCNVNISDSKIMMTFFGGPVVEQRLCHRRVSATLEGHTLGRT